MGELVPRNYLWLEKLVGDKCKELRDGEQKDGQDDSKENGSGKESGKEGKERFKKDRDRDRDSRDRDLNGSFTSRSSLDLASQLDGEVKGKGIPTIPWSQFINLGQICTIKVCP